METKLELTENYYNASKKQKYDIFVRDILDQIAFEFDVSKRDNGSFMFQTKERGVVDFYPKSNRLLIREINVWKNEGLMFIENKLNSPLNPTIKKKKKTTYSSKARMQWKNQGH